MPRKEKKFHFIYKTTNLLSGKYYIGMHSTDSLEDGYLGSGKRLRYSINKHGVENHVREILEFVDSREELKKREKEIVSLDEIAKEACMNLIVGGEGGRGFTSEEALLGRLSTNEKYADKLLEWSSKGGTARFNKYGNNQEFFKKRCDWSGKKHSEESKRLMSEVKKGTGVGKCNSQYGTCWINKEGVNKKIKKEEFNSYIKDNWVKGRKVK